MKYCTVAKSMGRDRTNSVEVNGCAHVACALGPSRSIQVAIFLNHDCADRCANDAFLTSFRATLNLSPRHAQSILDHSGPKLNSHGHPL